MSSQVVLNPKWRPWLNLIILVFSFRRVPKKYLLNHKAACAGSDSNVDWNKCLRIFLTPHGRPSKLFASFQLTLVSLPSLLIATQMRSRSNLAWIEKWIFGTCLQMMHSNHISSLPKESKHSLELSIEQTPDVWFWPWVGNTMSATDWVACSREWKLFEVIFPNA